MIKQKRIALLGNPNCGKSSLFNQLTGLNQKVGNFAGVTTERRSGRWRTETHRFELVDLPGIYSLYPRSEDEQVALRALLERYFDTFIVVVDANNLRRSLLLLLQLHDLGTPIIVALNMVDEAFRSGYRIAVDELALRLGLPVIATNGRSGEGLELLRKALEELPEEPQSLPRPSIKLPEEGHLEQLAREMNLPNIYWAHLYVQNTGKTYHSSKGQRAKPQTDLKTQGDYAKDSSASLSSKEQQQTDLKTRSNYAKDSNASPPSTEQQQTDLKTRNNYAKDSSASLSSKEQQQTDLKTRSNYAKDSNASPSSTEQQQTDLKTRSNYAKDSNASPPSTEQQQTDLKTRSNYAKDSNASPPSAEQQQTDLKTRNNYAKDSNASPSSTEQQQTDLKTQGDYAKDSNASPPSTEQQHADLKARNDQINKLLKGFDPPSRQTYYRRSEQIDHILTHKVYGSLTFLGILVLIFQGVFAWSEPLMEGIDFAFAILRVEVSAVLPEAAWSRLLTNGVLTGMGGILIFVPQIAFLFLVMGLLEESGYMSRVVSLSDRMMRKFGLDARSVIPLVSGMACAIPAVMSSRGIPQKKERLITILVLPLMTCSARLPVYTMLIGLIFVDEGYWWIFNLQGLVLMGMYLLGIVAALVVAWLLHQFFPSRLRSFLVLELPPYRWPMISNVLRTVYHKSKRFVLEAGQVIIAISIILWALSSYGGKQAYEQHLEETRVADKEVSASDRAMLRLEYSYMGQIGKQIEPLIQPLGYDWKIGIALIGSFAAREVFVSTLAMIYSFGGEEADEKRLRTRLRAQKTSEGTPVFTTAVCVSLLIFYAFAMQCMSTLAVVYRETRSIRWPIFQLIYMSAMAYVTAWIAYTIMA